MLKGRSPDAERPRPCPIQSNKGDSFQDRIAVKAALRHRFRQWCYPLADVDSLARLIQYAARLVRNARDLPSLTQRFERQSKDLVMGTDKHSADKAKAAVERVEAEEDEARAKTGQRPTKPAQGDRPRGASFNRPK